MVRRYAEQTSIDVVAAALKSLPSRLTGALSSRELLAGCEIELRREIQRIQAAAKREAYAKASAAERQEADAARDAEQMVEEAAAAVRRRRWDSIGEDQREAIREHWRRQSQILRATPAALERYCIDSMDDWGGNEAD